MSVKPYKDRINELHSFMTILIGSISLPTLLLLLIFFKEFSLTDDKFQLISVTLTASLVLCVFFFLMQDK